MERRLRPNVVLHPALRRSRMARPTSEVNYETQSPFVVPERTRHRRVLQAAIHVTQRPRGLIHDGAGRASGFDFVDHPTAGLVDGADTAGRYIRQRQRHAAPATGGSEPTAEVTVS